MKVENLLATIARLRRSMPRNADAMTVCDALEYRLKSAAEDGPQPGFDRTAYQRQYMRRWRAAKRGDAECPN